MLSDCKVQFSPAFGHHMFSPALDSGHGSIADSPRKNRAAPSSSHWSPHLLLSPTSTHGKMLYLVDYLMSKSPIAILCNRDLVTMASWSLCAHLPGQVHLSHPRLFLLSQWQWPGYPSNFSAWQWAATIPSTTRSEFPSKLIPTSVFFCPRIHFEFSFHLYRVTLLSLFNNSFY